MSRFCSSAWVESHRTDRHTLTNQRHKYTKRQSFMHQPNLIDSICLCSFLHAATNRVAKTRWRHQFCLHYLCCSSICLDGATSFAISQCHIFSCGKLPCLNLNLIEQSINFINLCGSCIESGLHPKLVNTTVDLTVHHCSCTETRPKTDGTSVDLTVHKCNYVESGHVPKLVGTTDCPDSAETWSKKTRWHHCPLSTYSCSRQMCRLSSDFNGTKQ